MRTCHRDPARLSVLTPKPRTPSRRPPAAEGLFKAVSSSRVSQLIVDQIRMLLKEERLQPGDRLPSERELCTQFGGAG